MTDHAAAVAMTPERRARGPRRRWLPPVFESLAHLFAPADPRRGTLVVEAGDDWSMPPDPGPEVDVLLWGQLPRNERPSIGSVAFAVRREAAILNLRTRPRGDLHLAELHRLPPVSRPGSLRRPIRSAALGGALAELVRGGERPNRVIDEVASAAGATSLGPGVRPSGDGSALARLELVDGSPAELRVSQVGHTKDPERGRAALLALADADIPLVPRPLDSGTTGGAAWATETVLGGEHVHALTPELLEQIVRFLAGLPSGPPDRRAIDDQLAEVALVFPEHAAALRSAASATARWGSGLPTVLLHGDLWLNNIFVDEGRLSGVFDWDTWHPAGLPGTDLLNLLAAEVRTEQRRDVGELLVDDMWRSTDVLDALRTYFALRGLPFPDRAGLAAIAVGWWSSRMAGSLYRAGRPTEDPGWVERNLDTALDKIAALERELG